MSFVLKNLHKTFGSQIVFNGIDFNFSTSGLYVISGASGTGKTTLLNIIAGYEPFDYGERSIDKNIQVVCIFQNHELIEALTVRENIELYEKIYHCVSLDKGMILNNLGISELLDYYPNECSQGQKQRVGIARALLMNPQIILCDEPTESLDQENKKKVMELLVELAKTKVVILATHELDMIQAYKPDVYTCKDHKLVGGPHKGNEVVNSAPVLKADKRSLSRILRSILHKKTKIQFIAPTILTAFLLLLMQFDITAFAPRSSWNALNANNVYLTSDSEVYNVKELSDISDKPEVILPTDFISIDGKEFRATIVPFEENKKGLSIQGEIPPNNLEVIINQNVANLLTQTFTCKNDELFNKTLKVPYMIMDARYYLDFSIKGIVKESDVGEELQVFYNKEDVLDYLKQQKTGETSIYDDIMRFPQKFMITMPDDSMSIERYKAMQDRVNSFQVYNTVLEVRETIQREMAVFHIVFQTLLILIATINVLYILYDLHKEWKKQVFNLAIFYGCQVPLHQIGFCYFKIKSRVFLFSYAMLFIEVGVFIMLFHPNEVQIQLMLKVLFSMLFLILLWLIVHIVGLKKTKLALLLKNDKDMK